MPSALARNFNLAAPAAPAAPACMCSCSSLGLHQLFLGCVCVGGVLHGQQLLFHITFAQIYAPEKILQRHWKATTQHEKFHFTGYKPASQLVYIEVPGSASNSARGSSVLTRESWLLSVHISKATCGRQNDNNNINSNRFVYTLISMFFHLKETLRFL